MKRRNIVEDAPSLRVPILESEDEYMLNLQSAFNRSFVEKSERCGCFHCGSIFSGDQIENWMSEVDGDDTALCPYCGMDAIIVGTEEFPLSTALLSRLYKSWFEEEFEERLESANSFPDYFGGYDYLRKGIPFRYEHRPEIKVVGEIRLFPLEIYKMDPYIGGRLKEDFLDKDQTETHKASQRDGVAAEGAIVKVRAHFNSEGYYVSEFIDAYGNLLPYDAWTGEMQDLLLELTDKYPDRLQGMVKEPDFITMQLFVESESDVPAV